MDTNLLVSALIVIPMTLIISVMVFDQFANATDLSTAQTLNITNESVGTGVGQFSVANYCKSVTSTTNGTVVTNFTNYTWFALSYGPCNVTFGANGLGAHNVTYVSYTGSYYNTLVNIRGGTYNGFTLSSMLPYIYIAVTVITVILGAFGLSKIF